MKLLQLLVLLSLSTWGTSVPLEFWAQSEGVVDNIDEPTYKPTTDSSYISTEEPTELFPTYTPTMRPTAAKATAVSQTTTTTATTITTTEVVEPTMYPTYNPTITPTAKKATQAQVTSSAPTIDDDTSYFPTLNPTDFPTYIPTIMPAATKDAPELNNMPTVYDGVELVNIEKNSDVDTETALPASALSQSQPEEAPNKPSRVFAGILVGSMLIFVAYGFGVYRRKRSDEREEIPADEQEQHDSTGDPDYSDDPEDIELV